MIVIPLENQFRLENVYLFSVQQVLTFITSGTFAMMHSTFTLRETFLIKFEVYHKIASNNVATMPADATANAMPFFVFLGKLGN